MERTVIGGPDPLADTDAFLAAMSAYAALGITKAWVGPPLDESDPVAWTTRVAELVLPRVRDL